MNIPLLIANFLTLFAFIVHTFVGDKELRILEPTIKDEEHTKKREKWTMARCGWHWISFDLFATSLALCFVNFTNFFDNKTTILQILAFYYFSYAIFWLFTIAISKPFQNNYLKLGQWILLASIGFLIFLGI